MSEKKHAYVKKARAVEFSNEIRMVSESASKKRMSSPILDFFFYCLYQKAQAIINLWTSVTATMLEYRSIKLDSRNNSLPTKEDWITTPSTRMQGLIWRTNRFNTANTTRKTAIASKKSWCRPSAAADQVKQSWSEGRARMYLLLKTPSFGKNYDRCRTQIGDAARPNALVSTWRRTRRVVA